MSDEIPRSLVSEVMIRASRGSEYKASASVVLRGGVRLSGFRLRAGPNGAVAVVWTEPGTDGEYAVSLPPTSVPWDECQRAILEAYERSKPR
jgi:hypothetical protein